MNLYQSQNRKAEILKCEINKCFVVRLWENDKFIEDRLMKTGNTVHNITYAQDCAANWISNVF